MATTTRAELDELVGKIRKEPGWEVIDLGVRWRVTNSAGGGPMFIQKRPPSNNTLKTISDNLIARGWNPFEQAEAAEADRRARVKADQDAAEKRIQELQEALDRQAAEAAQTETENAHRLTRLRALARTLPNTGGVRKDVLLIDGDFARDLLKHNRFFDRRDDAESVGRTNRPFSNALARYYMEQMLDGDWLLTHQGLALDADGMLIDGQHRLVAIMWAAEKAAETGKPFPGITTEITYDLPPESFAGIDQGRTRSASTVLALEGIPYRHVVPAALKLITAFDRGVLGNLADARDVKVHPAKIISMFRAVEEPLLKAIRRAHPIRHIIPPSPGSAALYLAERAYPGGPQDDFLRGLATGYDLREGDPRAALRSWADRIHRKPSRYHAHSSEWVGVMLKTWNYYLQDIPLKQLKLRTDEAFPTPIEKGKLGDIPGKWTTSDEVGDIGR